VARRLILRMQVRRSILCSICNALPAYTLQPARVLRQGHKVLTVARRVQNMRLATCFDPVRARPRGGAAPVASPMYAARLHGSAGCLAGQSGGCRPGGPCQSHTGHWVGWLMRWVGWVLVSGRRRLDSSCWRGGFSGG
jgi:hypothetical protein